MSSNHDALAATDAGPSLLTDASADGVGDGLDDDATALDAGDGSTDQAVDSPPPIQPDGPSVFSFVHAIPDSPALRVCFAVRSGSSFTLLPVAPWPSDAAGLAYAHAASASTVPGNVDLGSTDIRPIVLTGDLSQLGTSTCEAMSTPPAGVQASSLPVIPRGTLTHGRHVIMAAAGCVGGDTHQDTAQETICGDGYLPDHPTLTLYVASLDRAPSQDFIGLQVFNASLATPLSQVDHVVADPVTRTTIVSSLPPGAVAPSPPNYALTPGQLGGSGSANRLELFDSGMQQASSTVMVADAMARGGLASQDVVAGRNFTVVLVGPRAGTPDGAWWNGFTMTLLPSDP